MTLNPIINALAATAYISAVACFFFFGNKIFGPANSILAPIALLSLFTLSAAVMGYLFFYQPALLFLDGHKKTGINLFLKTLAVFAATTLLVLLLLLLKIF